MISIFSDYEPIIGEDCEEIKPSKIYDQLRNAYNQGAIGILENARLVSLGTADECDYDIIYEIWRNSRLHDIIVWINKKITLEIGKLDYRAIDVRLRIATNMLNKLVNEGFLSRDLNMRIHYMLVTNVRQEMSAINVEDLPFQGCVYILSISSHVDMRL